jgi:hypothetical protein
MKRLAIRLNLSHGILGRWLRRINSTRISAIFARMRFFTVSRRT